MGLKAMKRILLADDEEALRILVHTTLEDPDYEIVEACDGTSALALAFELRPDLAVLDWMMPGLTGVEVAASLRANAETSSIPIILLTAKGQADDKEAGRRVGVNSYLVKPFSPLELMSEVSRLLP